MSTSLECEKALLVQAELDGELGAADAAALAAHRAECPICQAVVVELTKARALVDGTLFQPMPEEIRGRIVAQITAAASLRRATASPSAINYLLSRWSQWWSSAASFGVGTACATAVALLVLVPRAPDLSEQIVTSHIRALQPGHLEDIASTDQHTVKPWFDGRIDFAPPVKDLAAERFPLLGGRLDYVAGRPVAAMVYQRDKHVIDLFAWPAAERAPRPPETLQRQGYNLVSWSEDGMMLWAVSDIEPSELRGFAEVWRRSP
jgi:anti-sigma factor RsiW